jgi:hypothetical protein
MNERTQDDVDRLLTQAGELWRAEQPPIVEPDTDRLTATATRKRHVATRTRTTTVPRRPSMPRRLAVAATMAAALTAGLVVAASGSDHAKLSPAAALFNQAAVHSLRTGDPTVGPGQYRYLRTHAWYLSIVPVADGGQFVSFLTEQLYEEWIPADEHGVWYWRYTRPMSARFFSAADEKYIKSHHPDMLARGLELYEGTDGMITRDVTPGSAGRTVNSGATGPGWSRPTIAWLAALPREPDALLARIYADNPASKGDGKPSKYDQAFTAISDLLRSGLVAADLQAALYRAAAKLSGITLVDSTANLDGQHGVAIGLVDASHQSRHDIIFDAAAGRFIGEREVALQASDGSTVRAGAVTASTAVTLTVVDEPGFH